MATQEPNVYAGLSVVIGGLMHARPRFFAKVMGELLFWVGEDKMLFGSDYGIWEPKWQVEGLVGLGLPRRRRSPTTRRSPRRRRRRSSASTRPLSTASRCRTEYRLPEERRDAGRPRRRRSWSKDSRVTSRAAACLDALGKVYDPELDEPITSLRFVSSCEVSAAGDVDVRLRLPTPQCAPNFAYLMAADARDAVRRLPGGPRASLSCSRTTTPATRSTPPSSAATGFARGLPGGDRGRARAPFASLFHRKALVARQSRAVRGDCWPPARPPRRSRHGAWPTFPHDPEARRCIELREQLGLAAATRPPAFVLPDGEPIAAARPAPLAAHRAAHPYRASRPTAGICRSLLRVRYDVARRGGGGRMKAARLHEYHQPLKLEEVDEPKAAGPLDVVGEDRRGGSVPHRPAHPGRAVGREVRGRVALHAGSRERRLDPRGRARGHQRRGRRHGDRPPVHLLRPVPARAGAGDDMHCAERLVPRHQPRRRLRRLPVHQRALGGEARSVARAEASIAALADAGLTAIHAVKKAIPVLGPGTRAVVIGAGGLGHIGIQCLKAMTPDRDHRRRPQREGARAGGRAGRRPHRPGRWSEPHRDRARS